VTKRSKSGIKTQSKRQKVKTKNTEGSTQKQEILRSLLRLSERQISSHRPHA
jgi:hypothetical protein